MLFGRCIAFTLDLLLLTLGAFCGFLVAHFSMLSSNTIGSMGNIVVFVLVAVGGSTVALVLLLWIVTVTGRSPGQRVMGVRYDESGGRGQRARHYALAWLLPVFLVVIPALALNWLGNYRGNLQRAYMDHTQVRSESDSDQPAYKEKLSELERQLKRADWFAPEWLVGNDGLPWMLVMFGPLLIYLLTNIVLLRRPPHAALHDRISRVRIVAA